MKKKTFNKLNLRQQKILARSYLLGAFLLATWLSFAPRIGFYALYKQSSYNDALAAKEQQLIKENADYKARIASLENDPKVLEEFARREHMMLKEKEHLYVFPSKDK